MNNNSKGNYTFSPDILIIVFEFLLNAVTNTPKFQTFGTIVSTPKPLGRTWITHTIQVLGIVVAAIKPRLSTSIS